MEKQVGQYQFWSELFKREITVTIDESLDRLKDKVEAPQKQAESNERLLRLKERGELDKLPK